MASIVNNSVFSENETEGQASGTSNISKVFDYGGNNLGSFYFIKLNHDNFLLRKEMVLPVIRGNKMEGFIMGAKQCPPEFTAKEATKSELQDNFEYEN